LRVKHHPILDEERRTCNATIIVDGKEIPAMEGEPIAAALLAAGIRKFRETPSTISQGAYFAASAGAQTA